MEVSTCLLCIEWEVSELSSGDEAKSCWHPFDVVCCLVVVDVPADGAKASQLITKAADIRHAYLMVKKEALGGKKAGVEELSLVCD